MKEESCEICDAAFEHDQTTAFFYKFTGRCLCGDCVAREQIKQETKDDCRELK